jgi:hypothetical protein
MGKKDAREIAREGKRIWEWGGGAFRRTIFIARSRLISWLFSPLSESDSEDSEELASFFVFLALDLRGHQQRATVRMGEEMGRVVAGVSRSLRAVILFAPLLVAHDPAL